MFQLHNLVILSSAKGVLLKPLFSANAPIAVGGTQPRRSSRVSKATGGILGRVTLKASKSDTVLHVKRKVNFLLLIGKHESIWGQAAGSFNIAVSSQRLFYRGTELLDDKATMAGIKLMTNSTIYLKEAGIEIDEEEDGDGEMEAGFSGTKLHLSSRIRPESGAANEAVSGDEPMQQGESDQRCAQGSSITNERGETSEVNGHMDPPSPIMVDSSVVSKAGSPIIEDSGNPCPTCTFINDKEMAVCEMCDTLLSIL